jgi:DHA1 family bicyclomycin/chloramphenicol resistance-like MFS transporter
MTIPSLQLRVLSADPRLVGSAAGLMGFAQMACGALATLLIGHLYDGTAVPAAIFMLLASVGALGLLFYARRPKPAA